MKDREVAEADKMCVTVVSGRLNKEWNNVRTVTCIMKRWKQGG